MKRGLTSIYQHRQLLIILAIQSARGAPITPLTKFKHTLMYFVLASSTGGRELLNYYSAKDTGLNTGCMGVCQQMTLLLTAYVHKNIKVNALKRVEHCPF